MTITTQTAQAGSATTARLAKWAPLAVILSGTFACMLDFFVVNVALPDIQRSLSAGPAAIEWVVAGYGLTSAAFLVCGGRLGDHYGRRLTFCAGLALFTVTSALCAAAPDAGFLVAARLAQGFGAAIMALNVLSILGTTYTGPDRVRAISVYGMVMGVAAVGGQLLGGLLIDANIAGLGWRAIFWINVPIGAAALIAAPRLVPACRPERAGRLDLTGAALLTATLVAVVLPLLDGRQAGWPAWSWACLAAAPVLLAAFVARLRRTGARGGQPLLDPGIFAVRAFRSGLACQVLFWCQQAAGYLLLALYLQLGRGLSPIGCSATRGDARPEPPTRLTIGEFSRMTHLSVKALRHYHDVGVLEPAAIDRFTGYRSYEASQVASAQVIRRLRDLGRPLDSIAAVLGACDIETRNREIAAHLARMERELEQTQASVAALRALLEGPPARPAIQLRAIPEMTALAAGKMVGVADFMEWGLGAFGDLSEALAATGLTAAGPFGALFPGDFFELERAELTLFRPVTASGPTAGPLPGGVTLRTIPAIEAAVAVHEGAVDDIDRTYAALGTAVAERAIGIDGPIREYYPMGFADTDDETQHRTEVCWPVFLTGTPT